MSLQSYFTLFKKPQNEFRNANVDGDAPNSPPRAFSQWLALFFGVLIQPFFSFYKEHGTINNLGDVYSNYYYIIFGIIIATIIFPSVYRQTFDASRPKFLQIIPIFTAGLGWQTMVDSLVNAATAQSTEEAIALIQTIVEHISFLA
ncbi:hypothetical protein Q4Q35_16570 [Flavivirga aquimarina]|uniref:Uncharacterized protein n=1 Tax=Flavivirga aquimarina TaxID=2027862 RepID=A0ABT8WEE2_9FLAO|nr:hypothetical protein [Flavivirga aquimarina]MDO5971422.1 hypothetical protein [Flavivirga aquimarina]